MAIFGFAIGALLVIGGFGSWLMAINLVPTEMGLTYALSAVILVGCGGISLTVAALIARIDAITAPRPRAAPPAPEPEIDPPAPPPTVEAPPSPVEISPPVEPAEDEEVNRNRAGRLPSLQEVERALAEPEAGPHVVGRYSAGGAKYAIYSDGSIEAETDDGGYRFASMDEFKAYIANRKD